MEMYTITHESFGKYSKFKIKNEENGMYLEVIPEKGAKVNCLRFMCGHKELTIIDGYDTPEAIEKNDYSKSSILAPFPNRVADGHYIFENKEYQLSINKADEHNAIHGFVEHEVFTVVEHGETENGYAVHLQFTSKDGYEGYPFPFTMKVTYTLTEGGLLCETHIQNIGSTNMPFGHGWHPYFKTDISVEELELQIPEVERIEVDERLVPTGNMSPYDNFLTPQKIGDTQFDTGFKLKNKVGRVTLFDRENGIRVSMVMEDEKNQYRYVQIFTPPKGSPAENTIAIEPMTCAADAFNNAEGLKVLTPNETFIGTYRVEVYTIEES